MSIPAEGATGFATTRFVRAPSPDEAGQIALDLVAASVAAEPSFALSPTPLLDVDSVIRVLNPLKLSRPNSGYTFIGEDAQLEDALRLERKVGKGFF